MKRFLACSLLASAFAGGALLPEKADGAFQAGGSVRIGLIASLYRNRPAAVMQMVMRPFKALLESQTGVTGQILAGGDHYDLAQKLKDEQVQIGVFHGFEFAWARQKFPGLRPLILAVNQRKQLYAHLVVRADSGIRSCAALEGKTVALPTDAREHARLFLERRCVKPSANPEKVFKLVTPTDFEEGLDDVVDGQTRAIVVDAGDLDQFRKLKPARAARLRSILVSDAFPCAVVAYHEGGLDEATLRRFQSSLVDAHSSRGGQRMLEVMRISGFEHVPADYDVLFNNIARAYPPPAPRK